MAPRSRQPVQHDRVGDVDHRLTAGAQQALDDQAARARLEAQSLGRVLVGDLGAVDLRVDRRHMAGLLDQRAKRHEPVEAHRAAQLMAVDHRAVAAPARDDAVVGQRLQRSADRGAADAQLDREVGLRWRTTLRETLVVDGLEQLVADAPAERARVQPAEGGLRAVTGGGDQVMVRPKADAARGCDGMRCGTWCQHGVLWSQRFGQPRRRRDLRGRGRAGRLGGQAEAGATGAPRRVRLVPGAGRLRAPLCGRDRRWRRRAGARAGLCADACRARDEDHRGQRRRRADRGGGARRAEHRLIGPRVLHHQRAGGRDRRA